MRKLRKRLSYANVMSTIAVFGVLAGGVAWALDRNAVKSRHIAPGEVKLSDTSNSLRLKCPAQTVFVEGACLERSSRAAAFWTVADDLCQVAGRRLPSTAELLSGRLEPGITLSSTDEWANDRAETVDGTRYITVGENGAQSADQTGDLFPYRCVARPKR